MKIKLGVFFGGRSAEHEISVISAMQAIGALSRDRYEVIPVYIAKDGIMYTSDEMIDIKPFSDIKSLVSRSKKVSLVSCDGKCRLIHTPVPRFKSAEISVIDVALPVVHGTNVEDGSLQGFFETLGLPYAGCGVTPSAVGMDKFVMKALCKASGIPVLPGIFVSSKDYFTDSEKAIARILDEIGLPCIIKPVNLGSSIGISLVNTEDDIDGALTLAYEFSSGVLVERAVTNIKEINVSCLGDTDEVIASVCEEPVGSGEILSYSDKYLQNGSKGGKQQGMQTLKRKLPADIPQELSEQIKRTAKKAFNALGCSGVSRIDFIIDGDSGEYFLNEINTIPGSLSFYLWEYSGLKFGELLDKLISLAFKKKRDAENNQYNFGTDILKGFVPNGKK